MMNLLITIINTNIFLIRGCGLQRNAADYNHFRRKAKFINLNQSKFYFTVFHNQSNFKLQVYYMSTKSKFNLF